MVNNIVVDKNIRLCYFMVPTNKGVGYICIALQRPEKGSSSIEYKAGFAFCSPQEGKQFSKQKARAMAVGRLAKFDRDHRNRLSFSFEATNIVDVFKKSLEIMENFKAVPGWVKNRKSLVFGLNTNPKLDEESPNV